MSAHELPCPQRQRSTGIGVAQQLPRQPGRVRGVDVDLHPHLREPGLGLRPDTDGVLAGEHLPEQAGAQFFQPDFGVGGQVRPGMGRELRIVL